MFNHEQQFITLYQTENQIKVGYKVFDKDKLLINQNSTVLSNKDKLPKELELIFQSKAKEIKNSFISTIISSTKEQLINSKDSYNSEDYLACDLNDDYKIIVPKEEISKIESYFGLATVDYIFSPIQILYQHFLDNPSTDTLTIFLFDDKLYALYIDKSGTIKYFFEKMTDFLELSKSNFYENEIKEQKLYDEIYYLEVFSKIKEIIKQLNIRINKISIYYDVKQLSPDDIFNLKKSFAIDISYKNGNILETLFFLSQTNHKSKSYIQPKLKKKSNFIFVAAAGVLITLGIAGSLVYYFDGADTPKPKKQVAETIKYLKASLPNHTIINERLIKEINFVFESIPQEATLKDVNITEVGSKLNCEFAKKDIFTSQLKDRFALFYKNTNVNFSSSKAPFTGTIINDIKHDNILPSVKATKDYQYTNTILTEDATKIITTSSIPNSTVTFENIYNSTTYQTFNYRIKSIVVSPKEFFDFVDVLNKSKYSINITYPISFKRSKNGIEIDMKVQFNQKLPSL